MHNYFNNYLTNKRGGKKSNFILTLLRLTFPTIEVRLKVGGAASPHSCRHFSTQVTFSPSLPLTFPIFLLLSCLTASISSMAFQLSFSQQLNSIFFFFFPFLFFFPLCSIIYNVKCNKASILCK